MSIYFVSLTDPNEEVWKKIKDRWPDRHFILDERRAFVALPGLSVVNDVREPLGIDTDGRVSGLVAEIDSAINGYARKSLWEWLRKARS